MKLTTSNGNVGHQVDDSLEAKSPIGRAVSDRSALSRFRSLNQGTETMRVLKRKRGQSIKIGPNISIIVLHADHDMVRLGVKTPNERGTLACLCDPPLREFVDRWRRRSELIDIKTAV